MAKNQKDQKGIPLRILVAVLLDGVQYQPNTALLVDGVRAKSLVEGGQADDSDAAVEYALTQGELVTHVVPVAVSLESDVSLDPALDVATGSVLDPVVDPSQG